MLGAMVDQLNHNGRLPGSQLAASQSKQPFLRRRILCE
jgi:hypothetical protein